MFSGPFCHLCEHQGLILPVFSSRPPAARSPGLSTLARKASPNKPLIVIAGGALTTVANALLFDPEIGPNMVVFGLTVSYYGYNGKDGWSAYVVAKRTRLVEWATKMFWE